MSFDSKQISGAFGVFGTDSVADASNYETLWIEAWNQNGYGIFSGKNGTGSARPITIDATGSTRGNLKQLHLATSGNVGVGTTSPTAKLEVVGTVKFAKQGDIPMGEFGLNGD